MRWLGLRPNHRVSKSLSTRVATSSSYQASCTGGRLTACFQSPTLPQLAARSCVLYAGGEGSQCRRTGAPHRDEVAEHPCGVLTHGGAFFLAGAAK